MEFEGDCHGQQAALAMTPLYKIVARPISSRPKGCNDTHRTVHELSAGTARSEVRNEHTVRGIFLLGKTLQIV